MGSNDSFSPTMHNPDDGQIEGIVRQLGRINSELTMAVTVITLATLAHTVLFFSFLFALGRFAFNWSEWLAVEGGIIFVIVGLLFFFDRRARDGRVLFDELINVDESQYQNREVRLAMRRYTLTTVLPFSRSHVQGTILFLILNLAIAGLVLSPLFLRRF